MSKTAKFFRCPVCGGEAPAEIFDNVPDGWLSIWAHGPGGSWVHVCGWVCAVTYANQQASKPPARQWPWRKRTASK
jgi:hypothetical protein